MLTCAVPGPGRAARTPSRPRGAPVQRAGRPAMTKQIGASGRRTRGEHGRDVGGPAARAARGSPAGAPTPVARRAARPCPGPDGAASTAEIGEHERDSTVPAPPRGAFTPATPIVRAPRRRGAAFRARPLPPRERDGLGEPGSAPASAPRASDRDRRGRGGEARPTSPRSAEDLGKPARPGGRHRADQEFRTPRPLKYACECNKSRVICPAMTDSHVRRTST